MKSARCQRSHLRDAALECRRRGWSVIPIGKDKKPAIEKWLPLQKRAADESEIREMFEAPNVTGLAIITGAVSGGLAIRDFDVADSYQSWARANPDDAASLPTVQTRRGYHVYGLLAHECFQKFGDGELRGDAGHYTLAPPSAHPLGGAYTWTVPLPYGELPPLPDSLTEREGEKSQDQAEDPGPTKNRHEYSCLPSDSDVSLDVIIAATLPAGPGQHDRCIFELARRLKAAKPHATKDELREIVRCWHGVALSVISEKSFSYTWSKFARGLEAVRVPFGPSFAAAVTASGYVPPGVARLGYDGALLKLAALCWQLSQQWGETPFPLGCEKAGEYLGVSTRHAHRYLYTLKFDEVLQLASKGTKASRKASEWLFIAK